MKIVKKVVKKKKVIYSQRKLMIPHKVFNFMINGVRRRIWREERRKKGAHLQSLDLR